jgi:hypothetical protein
MRSDGNAIAPHQPIQTGGFVVQAIPQFTTFDQFIAWYPEDGRYELINGRVREVKPTTPHEQVGGYLNRRLTVEMDRLELPYFIPKSFTGLVLF